MRKKIRIVDWKEIEKKWMESSRFREMWKGIEPEYQIARSVVAARLKRGLTQAQLARKIGTKQPVISRLESMQSSPSLRLLKRIANALGLKLQIRFAEG